LYKTNKFLISIVGPTASGKTGLSLELAREFETEIINADSRQVYKELDIGTAKPTMQELGTVKHHLLDFLAPCQSYNVAAYEKDALAAINSIFEGHGYAILAGGTGLYFNAVWNGIDEIPSSGELLMEDLQKRWKQDRTGILTELEKLDKVTYEKIDIKNPRRVLRALSVCIASGKPYSSFLGRKSTLRNFHVIKLGLSVERSTLYQRINKRVDAMMEAGLLSEVEALLQYKDCQSMQSVGYRELVSFLQNEIPLEEAIDMIKRNSRRYAKRQMTWFRKVPDIHWLSTGDSKSAIHFIKAEVEKMA
jgi:tRNA dimethylallyltransferase